MVIRSRLTEQVGRVVGGRYRLLAPVGTGASADVYVADDVTLRRRVAIKLLHEALAADDGFLRRFRAEARNAASLRHPNIMAVFDWGEEPDGPFLVLEYLSGGSLRDLMDQGHRLTLSQATLVGLEAARGLDHAHRRGLVHRDVKPANLLFDDEGRLAIADFGIARALAEATWTEPVGAVVGTARYASPEQARGSSLDGRADVYALALVLVEAVTGSVPFAADTTLATIMGRLDRPIPVPSELGVLGSVIEAAGAVDPAGRVDAAGMVRGLESVAAQLPRPDPLPLAPAAQSPFTAPRRDDITTVFVPPAPPVPPEAAPPPTWTQPAPPSPFAPPTPVAVSETMVTAPRRVAERRRRWRYPWVAIAVILVAAIVGVVLLLRQQGGGPLYDVPSLVGEPFATASAANFKLVKHDVREGLYQGKINVIVRQSPPPNTRHHAGTITVDVTVSYPLVAVPSLAGMTQTQAQQALATTVLDSRIVQAFSDTVPAGTVADWSDRGTQVPQHRTITVTISGGPRLVPMPDVTGKPVKDAISALYGAGITNSPTQTQAFSDTVPAGAVIATDPPPGAQADRSGTPSLTVSKGPDVVAVPSVDGMSVAQAEAAITSAGLVPGGPYGPPGAGIVVSTSPPGGRKIKRGNTVDIYAGYF